VNNLLKEGGFFWQLKHKRGEINSRVVSNGRGLPHLTQHDMGNRSILCQQVEQIKLLFKGSRGLPHKRQSAGKNKSTAPLPMLKNLNLQTPTD